jgi:hypothetical protein
MAYKYSERGTRPVSLIVIHTAEGARTAAALGAYFQRADIQASSHVGIDGSSTLQFVPYNKAAWTVRSGNPISENAELCGFARWTRPQWLSTGTVDGVVNPRAMVSRAAAWARSRALARGIPLTHLTPVQVGQNAWGLIDHFAWTIGKKDGTHTDVGGSFPWDVFMAEVLEGDDMSQQDIENIKGYMWQGGPSTGDGDPAIKPGSLMWRIQNLEGFIFKGGLSTRDEDMGGQSEDSIMGRLKQNERDVNDIKGMLQTLLDRTAPTTEG